MKVEPVYEWWNTPENYRHYPGGKELPDKLKVWRIQRISDKPGVLARPSGAVARPWEPGKTLDAEPLVVGYNTGKMNGAVAVGWHGNFLQWGFSAPPAQMTQAGRALFLNCVCCIVKFDGKGPAERR